MEAHGAPVDQRCRIKRGSAVHLTAETVFCIVFREDNTRFRRTQGFQHLLHVISDRGHDTHPRHNHSPHCDLLEGAALTDRVRQRFP